jgi:hypothetical protein
MDGKAKARAIDDYYTLYALGWSAYEGGQSLREGMADKPTDNGKSAFLCGWRDALKHQLKIEAEDPPPWVMGPKEV